MGDAVIKQNPTRRDRCNTYLQSYQSAIQIIGEILCRHSTHISVHKTPLSEWKINV